MERFTNMTAAQPGHYSRRRETHPVQLAVLMPHAPILVPAVGGERMHDADATVSAMHEAAARVVSSSPDALVLVSPHSPRQPKAFGIWSGTSLRGSFEMFGAPETGLELPNDAELAAEIAAQSRLAGVETWGIARRELDHGALVPLWHLSDAGWGGPTVVLSLNYPRAGGLVEIGQAITAAAAKLGRHIAVVASGDMSHRLTPDAPAGYDPQARQFDRKFIATVKRGAYRDLLGLDPELQNLAAEDAVDSTVIAAAAAGWQTTGHEVLSYEGPFGVGYGVAVLFDDRPQATAEGHGLAELPQVARASVQAALTGTAEEPPGAADEDQRQRHAVFVTIRDCDGALRGCVGTLNPRYPNVVEETWRLAREAAFQDGRFPPVQAAELPGLSFEVSVLQPLEDVATPEKLDPRRYGVVVTAEDGRRGALLPDIPEIRTIPQQLAIARRKGGIESWEPVRLERFTVVKHEEAGRVEHEAAYEQAHR
jgi:MEMO1 family protein